MRGPAWERRHKIALLIAAAIGAALGVVLGYMVYAVARGADGGVSFGYWAARPVGFRGIWWALFGAAAGSGMVYVRRTTSS